MKKNNNYYNNNNNNCQNLYNYYKDFASFATSRFFTLTTISVHLKDIVSHFNNYKLYVYFN